jgi:hypothetical protein
MDAGVGGLKKRRRVLWSKEVSSSLKCITRMSMLVGSTPSVLLAQRQLTTPHAVTTLFLD